MINRHPEEYHDKYQSFLADEIQRSREKFYLAINRYPYYHYEHDNVNAEAAANARARVRALQTPKEQLARQKPVIQRQVVHVHQPPNIYYKTEVNHKMFKYTAGIFTGLVLAVVALIVVAIYFFVIVPQRLQEVTDTITQPPTTIIVQPGPATAVWSNQVIPHPDRPDIGSSENKPGQAGKGELEPAHPDGIEIIKERDTSEGRNP